MFTGIITDCGEIVSIAPIDQGVRMRVRTAYALAEIPLGASIAHDGACLTVVQKGDDWLEVDVSPETLAKTTLGSWQAGGRVNLERPVQANGEFGGHFVTGHVDAVGEVIAFQPQGDFWRLEISIPEAIRGYVAPKGSVAVNGVSLTVNDVRTEPDRMQLMIIPHTAEVTTLGGLATGAAVNLEIDLVARYVASLLAQRA